jgi:preprotein translocase subunit YajC
MKSNHSDSKLIWEAWGQTPQPLRESDASQEGQYWADISTAVQRGEVYELATLQGVTGTVIDVADNFQEDAEFHVQTREGEKIIVNISDIKDIWRQGEEAGGDPAIRPTPQELPMDIEPNQPPPIEKGDEMHARKMRGYHHP